MEVSGPHRGVFFTVAKAVRDADGYMVIKVDTTKPRDGGVEGIVMGVDLTEDAAEKLAAKLTRKTMI